MWFMTTNRAWRWPAPRKRDSWAILRQKILSQPVEQCWGKHSNSRDTFMPKLSPGLQLAWHIAGAEAAMARYQCIEPEHLFIGLCKFANRPPDPAAPKPDVPQELVVALGIE